MADEQKMAFASATTVISLTASLSNGNVTGGTTELDNSTNLYPMALATFNNPDAFGATPTDRSTISLYMVRNDTDGANDDTSSPSGSDVEAAEPVGNFLIYDVNEEQRNSIVISLLGVKKADFYIKNNTGQTITYTSGAITVKITPFSIGR